MEPTSLMKCKQFAILYNDIFLTTCLFTLTVKQSNNIIFQLGKSNLILAMPIKYQLMMKFWWKITMN